MNRQSQWLFEAPVVTENNHYINPEYYGDSELGTSLCPKAKLNIEVTREMNITFRKDFDTFICGIIRMLDIYHSSGEKEKCGGSRSRQLVAQSIESWRGFHKQLKKDRKMKPGEVAKFDVRFTYTGDTSGTKITQKRLCFVEPPLL